MLSNLPWELVRGILLRIEAKYLTKLRWVCKKWKALISDRAFTNQHLLLHDEDDDQHILTWDNSSFFSLAFDPPPLGIQKHTLHEIPSVNQIKYMVHCDGLLLCATHTKKLGVWNPCLRQFRWVPGTDFIQGLDLFGLGYNHHRKSQDGYKIVRFHDRAADNEEEESEEEEAESSSAIDTSVRIFEFETDTWRVVEASEGWSVRMPCLGVSLKGNYYWIAYRHGTNGWFIQSFDFSTETFKPLHGFLNANPFDTMLLAGFRGDGLSVLHQCRETERIEVWVTNKIGCAAEAEEEEVLYWSSLMKVESPETPMLHHDFGHVYSYPCFFVHKKRDEVVVCCDGERMNRRRVCIFGAEGDEMREMDVGPRDVYEFSAYQIGYVFVPTLVPLPHPASVVQLQDP